MKKKKLSKGGRKFLRRKKAELRKSILHQADLKTALEDLEKQFENQQDKE